jgi:hypothetical protein
MIKEIKKKDFKKKIEKKDGDFSACIFDFPILFLDYTGSDRIIDFELDFSKSIFKKEVSFAKVTFTENVNLSNCQVEENIDFFNIRMMKNFGARKTKFFKKINFSMARFYSDADFSYMVCHLSAHFKKARFSKNLFMGKVTFFKKIDFSYAHFSNDYYTSFSSINKVEQMETCLLNPPYFIFRNIFFPEKTIFNDIDLSKTVFQDSVIHSIIFKDCTFPKKQGRNAFYTEISKKENIEIDSSLTQLLNREVNTIIIPNNEHLESLNIGDILDITSKESGEKELFFIVTRYDSTSSTELKDILQRVNLSKMYSGFNKIVCQDCVQDKEENQGVVGFRLKKFRERKH